MSAEGSGAAGASSISVYIDLHLAPFSGSKTMNAPPFGRRDRTLSTHLSTIVGHEISNLRICSCFQMYGINRPAINLMTGETTHPFDPARLLLLGDGPNGLIRIRRPHCSGTYNTEQGESPR